MPACRQAGVTNVLNEYSHLAARTACDMVSSECLAPDNASLVRCSRFRGADIFSADARLG